MIWRRITWFEKAGSVSDLLGLFGCSDAEVGALWLSVLEDPSAYTRHRSAQLDIDKTSLQKILKLDLKT